MAGSRTELEKRKIKINKTMKTVDNCAKVEIRSGDCVLFKITGSLKY